MRTSSSPRNHEKVVWKLISLLICLSLFTACASKPPRRAMPIKERKPALLGPQKEIIRSEQQSMASSPEQRTSAMMVDQGRRELTNGELERAEHTFQEAINIAPRNGIAYYYLAKVKYELSKFDAALGVLDKAEELLAASKEWVEAIMMLKDLIRGRSP